MNEDSISTGSRPAGTVASRRETHSDLPTNPIDEAYVLLQLAGRLHSARGNSQVWSDVLTDYRLFSHCHGVLNTLPHVNVLTPDALSALAGQLSHCATYGDDCGHEVGDKRQRCAAFAVHVHTAAVSAHKANKSALFDHLPATWLLDRNAQVFEANAAAKALMQIGESVVLVEARLALAGPGGSRALLKALAKVQTQIRLPWKDLSGNDLSFLLHALPDTHHIAVTALLDAPSAVERAPLLAVQLGLTPRQSELAAHLLADQTLAGAARAMGISRHTANEHLAALAQRTGAPDRKALLVTLRRVAQR
jgi:DNA-binding CsgD family transcriptional regulator